MSDYESVDGVRAAVEGSTLRLTLDRPRTRNSLDDLMMRTLTSHIETAGQDEALRVIVLQGANDDFCAGADIVAKNRNNDVRPRAGSIQRRLPTTAHRLVPVMLSTQTPIVSLVRGWASGIGFHLALASDFCVADERARFWEPFLARGFTPDSGATWLLPRLVGMTRARELLLLGRELSGTEAAAWGLIHTAVEADDVEPTAAELIARLADAPTVAVGLTKWLLQTGASLDLEHHLHNESFALELSSRTEDFREGLAAFKEKRDPEFKGR